MALAGPGATILAFVVVGLIAWGAMDGLGEMVVFWPVPNPLVQFVQTFVDRELGTVVHFAYWYTYAISTVAVITTAGGIVQYWSQGSESNVSKALIFVTFPIIILLVNCSSVKVFGYIELFGGSLKLFMVAGLALIMFLIDWGVGPAPKANLSSCIQDGFQTHIEGTDKSIAAVLAISLAVFPYVGVETFTITAFEAKNSDALKFPSKRMVPFVMFLYTLSVFGFSLNVPWTNGFLPAYYNSWTPRREDEGLTCHNHRPRDLNRRQAVIDFSNSSGHVLPTIAIDLAGINVLSGFSWAFQLLGYLTAKVTKRSSPSTHISAQDYVSSYYLA
ncbi:hypothetical protein D6D06_02846 [Aureobasidium pullulans]|nr:hypothetical protein D6D06_02846 [Aureobasidium pullulans]